MIKGIGNDIVEIERIQKAIQRPQFLHKVFTEAELALYEQRHQNIEILAGNFSVKEAVSKVFGTGVRDFGLKDIEVLRDDLGKPIVLLYNEAKNIAKRLGIESIHVSISHSEKYVVSVAIGEGV